MVLLNQSINVAFCLFFVINMSNPEQIKPFDSNISLRPENTNFSEDEVLYENTELLKTIKIQIVKRNNSDKNFGNLVLRKEYKDGKQEDLTISNGKGKVNEFFAFLIAIVELYKNGKIEPRNDSSDRITITLNLNNCKISKITSGKQGEIYKKDTRIIEEVIENSEFLSKDIFRILEKNKKLSVDVVLKFLEKEGLNNAFINQLIKVNPNIADIVVLKQRQNAVREFEKLIKEDKKESEFQKFFEKNRWIFGLCLDDLLIIPAQEEDCKYDFRVNNSRSGNEIDMLFKTKKSNNLVICELKLPTTELFAKSPNRNNTLTPSTSLSSAIQQTLMYYTVFVWDRNGKPIGNLDDGNQNTKVSILNFRLILLIGRYETLDLDEKKNFDTLRNAYKNLIITTYDELLAKARSLAGIKDTKSMNEVKNNE